MRISTLLTTLASVAATSAVGGLATGPAVQSDWYARLRKPAYQPPARVFPIVWPALYADIAVVSASAIDGLNEAGAADQRRAYQRALAVNLVLNAGWSWLFFNQRRFGAATVLSAVLTASGADLVRRATRARGPRAAALAPYPLWCAFATVLSGHIAVLNRRG
ncbi:TspO/MBR family protein [[Mycobacterium] kokjensenii]|uniref:TspO/MBR family protein n=1 Tax=[Mycobacterium] kokjensenii TaxID=3064287 RepID=A0ABM9LL62_9MYCO|nr:TspO/MBR family protein [Mycolicibacter sp. MU0083]CAJ1500951.1 TspO/MBR family protein [Mycolicibacter sp. MU0083]